MSQMRGTCPYTESRRNWFTEYAVCMATIGMWVSPFGRRHMKKVTQTSTQETYEMLTDPSRAKLWKKVVGKNKKGYTYGLINLRLRPNYHKAGPSGMALSAHLACHKSMMMKLLVKLSKKVERVTT
ncbi:hypothetical protein CRG98_009306 [Punica granatum]|uniref:Uncharacterized protein n=1 Tax=Punica granatum TaxID=22663 RepID=A0A2I0KPA1_PUNGR|nr:hypothetical protein CRG98_009306 [Punica granatum]